MAKFKYVALKNNSELLEGEIEAESLRDARSKIRDLGFLPTKVYDETQEIPSLPDNVKRLSLKEKILFTSELETMLSAGIPILEALNSIETNSPYQKLVEISRNLSIEITSGLTFSQSLIKLYSNVFGTVYTSLVKTGEEAGELEKTLERILVLYRKQDAIKSKIISASIYPCILVLMLIGLVILFSVFVFPRLAGVLVYNGADMPFMAQLFVDISKFIGNFWWLLLILIGAFWGAITSVVKNMEIKKRWDNFVLSVPVFSEFIRYINLSNFMTVLYIAYEGGVPIVHALELSNSTVANYTIKRRINSAAAMVKNGKTLTQSFKSNDVLPDALMSMVNAGEKSGNLGKMFKDASDVIDKKVDMTLEALTRLFEPAVMLILGGVVLFLLVAFMQMYAGVLGSLF